MGLPATEPVRFLHPSPSCGLFLPTFGPMENFFAYLERLELLGFFSGYPLLFAVILSLAGGREKRNSTGKRLIRSLPYAYALTGTSYAAMVLFNAWPQIDGTLISGLQEPWLRIWALLSLLFWLPLFSRYPILSLLHSLIFFFFLVSDLFFFARGRIHKDVIRNDMKIYGDSLLILLAAFTFIFILLTLVARFRESQRSERTP